MIVKPHPYDCVIYLLQGGGALGAYQVGVCESLINHHCAPDWLIGTSIGGINAAILAGNKPEDRIDKLKAFWQKISTPSLPDIFPITKRWHKWQNLLSSENAILFGQNGFFKLRMGNPFIQYGSPDNVSFYDTSILRATLEEFIDFELINQQKVRLTLGAVCVEDGEFIHFDNTERVIGPEHIMAASALPPGFPAVKIGEKHYWDGGLSCNTPLKIIFEEKVPRKLLCFMVDLFARTAEWPTTMMDVLKRKKDLEFASQYQEILKYFFEMHRLRHIIRQITEGKDKICYDDVSLGHPCALNIIRFHYRDTDADLWTKDFEFSQKSIQQRRLAGIDDVKKLFDDPLPLEVIPDDSGFTLHNF
ncbi:MAG: patatin-like phospholipase family protein [Candidatus Berkiella sp.]